LLVATILTLLVVPALYALWFRVPRDEPIDAFVASEQPAHPFDRQEEPFRIAAE
jgi:hypothetical protein